MNLSAVEMAVMQADQAAEFGDTCQIGTYSATQDAAGEPIAAYTYGTALACAFTYTVSAKQWSALMTVSRVDAVCRVPVGTTVTVRDRVKITKRWGTTLSTPLVFGVAGLPLAGPSAIVIPLVDNDL